jgi:hypothetical protein
LLLPESPGASQRLPTRQSNHRANKYPISQLAALAEILTGANTQFNPSLSCRQAVLIVWFKGFYRNLSAASKDALLSN